MTHIIFIPELPRLNKVQREKWFLQYYGSGVMNSQFVMLIEVKEGSELFKELIKKKEEQNV